MNQIIHCGRSIAAQVTTAFLTTMAISSAHAQAEAPSLAAEAVVASAASADIQWSRVATSTYLDSKLVGNYYDSILNLPFTTSQGTPKTYIAYSKSLTVSNLAIDTEGRAVQGSFSDTLTWTAEARSFALKMGVGTFTLSNLHWNLDTNGAALFWATASGTNVATVDLLAFSSTASSIAYSTNQMAFSSLTMSDEMFYLMADALAMDLGGLGFVELNAMVPNMGTLTVRGVPELSTGIQLSMGLLSLACLRRQRQTNPDVFDI